VCLLLSGRGVEGYQVGRDASATSEHPGSLTTRYPEDVIAWFVLAAPTNKVHSVFVHNRQLAWVGGWIFGHIRVELLRVCRPVGTMLG